MTGAPRLLAEGRVSHLFLEVRSVAVTVAFYADLLGFRRVYVEEAVCAFLELPGGPRLAFYERPGAPQGPREWFLVIDVADLDAAAAALRARGVDVGPVEEVPFGRAARFDDPDGHTLQLHQPEP